MYARPIAALLCAVALALPVLTPCTARAQTANAAATDGVKEIRLAEDRFERGAPVPPWVDRVTAIPVSQDKSPLVILLADTQILAGSPQSYYVHRAWAVNGTSALTEMGRQTIEFNPGYQRVKLHMLRIVRAGQPLDRLANANIRYLQRETALEQGMYSGDVTASILVDDLRVGDVLEVAYTTEGANPVIGPRFVQNTGWDQLAPTEWRRVTLLHPAQRKVAWRFMGDLNRDYLAPRESIEGGMRRLRWEARGLPRVEVEQGVPNDFNVMRYIQFSEFERWSDVTAWAVDLFRNTEPLPDELRQLVGDLQKKPTLDERVSGALSWVQTEIRYFSLSLGESSHRPTQPATTARRRWGDCKDKSFLLIELLRGLGVQAQPVLVSASTRRGLARQLPSPYAFDHVIVRATVNGREYFLDPTRQGQGGKLDAMGQLWEGAEVLVVQAGNEAFTTITSPNQPALTRDELVEKIALPRFGGDGTLLARHTWSGIDAEYRRMLFASWTREQMEKYTAESYERRYPGVRHATPVVVEDDTQNNVLTLVQNMAVPKMAVTAGGEWGIRYAAVNFRGMLPMPPSANRAQPYAISDRRLSKYSVEVEFPEQVSRMVDPVQRTVRDENFEFTVNSSFRGNRAVSSLELRVLGDTVGATRTAAYMESLRRANDIDPAVFVVRRDDIKAADNSGGLPGLQRMLTARLNDRLDKITRGIDSGRLSGDDLADAYCERAEAQVDLGNAAPGLQDAMQAVKLSPNLGAMYRCRASAYMALGDYARSIADYTRAITLDPSDSHAYYRRGHARYYAGQLAAAEQDFAKAGLDGKGDQDARLYAELWRVWTQKRLGTAPGPAQVQLASADPRGEWPRPALALLHGLLSVNETLALLEGKKGDDRDMALAEAYFYVGQYYLLQGNRSAAEDYFRRTRAKGVIVYIEHQSAGIELDLLGVKR